MRGESLLAHQGRVAFGSCEEAYQFAEVSAHIEATGSIGLMWIVVRNTECIALFNSGAMLSAWQEAAKRCGAREVCAPPSEGAN